MRHNTNLMNGKLTVTLHQPESLAATLCIMFMLMCGALQLQSPKGQKHKRSLYYNSARHTAKTQIHSVLLSECACVCVCVCRPHKAAVLIAVAGRRKRSALILLIRQKFS